MSPVIVKMGMVTSTNCVSLHESPNLPRGFERNKFDMTLSENQYSATKDYKNDMNRQIANSKGGRR